MMNPHDTRSEYVTTVARAESTRQDMRLGLAGALKDLLERCQTALLLVETGRLSGDRYYGADEFGLGQAKKDAGREAERLGEMDVLVLLAAARQVSSAMSEYRSSQDVDRIKDPLVQEARLLVAAFRELRLIAVTEGNGDRPFFVTDATAERARTMTWRQNAGVLKVGDEVQWNEPAPEGGDAAKPRLFSGRIRMIEHGTAVLGSIREHHSASWSSGRDPVFVTKQISELTRYIDLD